MPESSVFSVDLFIEVALIITYAYELIVKALAFYDM